MTKEYCSHQNLPDILIGPVKKQQLHWRVVVYHPQTDNIWMEDEEGHSNQWDGPWVVWLVTINEIGSLVIYTDSWVLFKA